MRQLWRDLRVVSLYLHFQGYKLGLVRLFKALIQTGLAGLTQELDRVRSVSEFTQKTNFDYVIVAPDYTSNSAGIYCLYKLCDDLNKNGFSAAITGALNGTPELNAPLIRIADARKLANGATWFVYPETQVGNPFGAKNVVRWVLNRPGLINGDKVYSERELVFSYSNAYVPYIENKVQGMLQLPVLDQNIFFPPSQSVNRSLSCYYVGKSTFKDGYFDKDKTFEITRTTPAKKDLGNLFRGAKVLYCFDNSTALTQEALSCGCPVVMIPDGTQTREEFEQNKIEGVMWEKFDEGIKVDTHRVAEKIAAINDAYESQLKVLVRMTNSRPTI